MFRYMQPHQKKQKQKHPGQHVFKVIKKKSACPICKKEFNKNWNLERHLLGHHKLSKTATDEKMAHATGKTTDNKDEKKTS